MLFLAGSSTRNICRDFHFAFGKMCILLIEKELFGRISPIHEEGRREVSPARLSQL